MSFNQDPSKQAQEVLFSNKATKTNHTNILFNDNAVQKKHFGLILDEKRTFNDHITSKHTTVNKLARNLRKLYHYMPRDFQRTPAARLCTCYIAIRGSIRGTSKEKRYQELRFETMKEKMRFRRLCCFCKILNNKPKLIFTV